ncbi:putative ABC transporter transmembrane region [Monocercomonoides exilis]|uniref:putative ABC transporter transmembrane region n=1 Tax=Monocercomonoides exilis TaxID=2049356 RepID=UPI003559B7CF|nr:putative ABC transporter transmembrane region [Monocercomonoides exilis]|eukprot:MONOS_11705.1-p1 / transcript=MONOS_11705.1 / gene=MONOS_11705 / organism=Monocercomonoides_exilis_PA203 / gene_product=unspecified product / transcript_product=unspecified product / location=Mono_scaffold00603:20083-20826(+) / protein_length=247 / sequence_SO=supercontig / SO=protein_coding / is_pseudo=false
MISLSSSKEIRSKNGDNSKARASKHSPQKNAFKRKKQKQKKQMFLFSFLSRFNLSSGFLFFLYISTSLFSSLGEILVNLITTIFRIQSAHAIKTDMYAKLFHAPMRFFDTTSSRMLNKKLNGVNPISYSVLHSFTATASSLAKLFSALVAIHSAMPALLLPVVLATSAMVLISHSTSLAKRRIYRSLVAARSGSGSFFKQCVEGAATIRAFGVQEAMEERQRELCGSQYDAQFNSKSVHALVANITS